MTQPRITTLGSLLERSKTERIEIDEAAIRGWSHPDNWNVDGSVNGSGSQGPQSPPGPPGDWTWLGAWDNQIVYEPGDGVSHNGSSYLAVAQTTTEPPSADWALLAAKGDTGAQGTQGNAGAQGSQGPAGPAPAGTGYVHVTGGVLDTPAGLTKSDVGLNNVDNTSDANKPVSSATQTALDLKVPTSRLVSAGTGLSGGGDLSADRSLAAAFGTTASTICVGNDARLSDARVPLAHATSHKSGGSDSIKLDELAAPTDISTLNASASAHGLLPKLSNNALSFLDGTGLYSFPITRISGASGAAGPLLTWQTLTSNSTANTTTDIFNANALVMSTTGVGVGRWKFKYLVRYQSAATTTGVQLAAVHTGTVSPIQFWWYQLGTGTTASTGIADNANGSGSAAAGQLLEGYTGEASGSDVAITMTSIGVAANNTGIFAVVESIVNVTVTGSLELRIASEINASGVLVAAGTFLELCRLT